MTPFLASEGLARVCIIGNVDDGKSTLVGRLLMATQSVRVNEIESLKATRFDLAHFTDGLKCEQEGAFTLDVGYRHLQLGGQRVLLADAPGHLSKFQSALTALSQSRHVILVSDGERALSPLLKLLARACTFFEVCSCVVAVTKQDRSSYQECLFRRRETELVSLFESTNFKGEVRVIPVSAVEDQNISVESPLMPWFQGPSLLESIRELIAQEKPRWASEKVSGQLIPFEGMREGVAFLRLDQGALGVGDHVQIPGGTVGLRILELGLGWTDFRNVCAPFSGWVTVSPGLSQVAGVPFWRGVTGTTSYADLICSCSREELFGGLDRQELWIESPWIRQTLSVKDILFEPVDFLEDAGGDDGSTKLGFLRVNLGCPLDLPESIGLQGLSLVDYGRRQVIGVGRWVESL